jgi:hypothetical protein
MIRKYPNDLLHYHCLAEHYLKSPSYGDEVYNFAVQLLEDLLIRDERNQHLEVEDIFHRAFCAECFKIIRGVRVKCVDARCGYKDRCLGCMNGPTGALDPCTNHHRIHIPRQGRQSTLRLPRIQS